MFYSIPGSTEGIAFIETIMEHIAKTVQKDPIEVKLNNVKKGDNNIPDIVKDLKVSSDYVQRRNAVENFNKVYILFQSCINDLPIQCKTYSA